jgi:uncharacterized membrane protein
MASIFNLDFLSMIIGYCLGLLLLLLLGFSLYHVAGKSPRLLLIALCAPCLLVFFASQALTLARILVARNMIPRFSWLMSLVILDLRDGFAFALTGLATLFACILLLRLRHEPLTRINPAQTRKHRAAQRRQRRFLSLILVCLLASSLSLTVLRRYENREAEISPPTEVFSVNGFIVLPLAEIDDGQLHRFVYTAKDGTGIRFILIKKSKTAYGVGLDACDICGPTGYFQRKDQVICKLCDVVMNISTIGFPGGCNPVPLPFSISQGALLIRAGDLEAEKNRFGGHY